MTSRESSYQFESLLILVLILVHNYAEAQNGPIEKITRKLFTQRYGVLGQKTKNPPPPLHSVLPEDKIGLAQIAEDPEEKDVSAVPERSLSLHRYQLYDIDIIVDNLFGLAADAFKHPPSQDDLYEAMQKYNQTVEHKSILGRVKAHISRCIGKAEDYAKFAIRYHRWFERHKRLELLDKDISTTFIVVFQEITRAWTEVRQSLDIPLSGAAPGEHHDNERESKVSKDRDIVLEVLFKTMDRLEQNLEDEDPGNLLGVKKDQPGHEITDEKGDQEYVSLKSFVMEQGTKMLVKGAKHMMKMAILGVLSSYLSDRSFPYEGFILYVGKLLGYMGMSSVSSIVDALRDPRTRTALTLTDLFNPSALSKLLRHSIG